MIDMKCPACGAEGRVPSDKVNTRLVCRKCLKVFHLTPSGRALLGEPAPAASGAMMAKEAAIDSAQEVEQWLDKLRSRLTSPATLGIAAALVLLAVVAAFLSTRKTETLQERVIKVANAAVKGDLPTIRSLATTGTADDAVKWYDTVHPQCDELRQRLGTNKLLVEVNIKQQEGAQGPSEIVARLDTEEQLDRRSLNMPDATISVPTTRSAVVSLPMSWRTEGWSGWKMDGKRSLELAAAGPAS
jgi:hypothetical protein